MLHLPFLQHQLYLTITNAFSYMNYGIEYRHLGVCLGERNFSADSNPLEHQSCYTFVTPLYRKSFCCISPVVCRRATSGQSNKHARIWQGLYIYLVYDYPSAPLT